MATVDMYMPQMGESITEGTIIKWHKKEGDRIEKEDILLEISTDKVDSEIPSAESGVIAKILFPEGETVQVGEVIAQINTNGDKEPSAEDDESADGAGKQTAVPEKALISDAVEVATQPASLQKSVGDDTKSTGEKPKRFYSPLVRNIAKAESVSQQELEQMPGSGSGGRLTKNDILAYLKTRSIGAASVQTTAKGQSPQPVYSDAGIEVIPMSNMRKSIAEHMLKSIQTSPHVFTFSEADMTELVRYRNANKDTFLERTGTKLTYMPFIVQACAKALIDFPLVNSSVDGTNILRKKNINIGMAVALENSGLIVPVIKNADSLSTVGLARAVNDLALRARTKKLKPEEVQDGTFSITNMGSFGSLMGLPIINQPQVAILGVGTIQKRPVVINDAIAIRNMMYISLSFDHRIVDGALGGRFLERIAFYLTNFDTNSIL